MSGGEVKSRILAIDVMRGMNMFVLIFLAAFMHSLTKAVPCPFLSALDVQFTHYRGFGLYAYDLVFPTFLFMAGCSWPFSLSSQLAKGTTTRQVVLRILKRLSLLIFVGLLISGLPSFDFAKMRLNSILGQIGAGWALMALLTLLFPRRWWLAALGLFAAYWLSFVVYGAFFAPSGAGPWAMGKNIISAVDRWMFAAWPGKYEGYFHNFGCACTAFVGYGAGLVLKRTDLTERRRAALLAAGAAVLGVCGAVTWATGLCPLSKAQWNPSYILVSGGIDLAVLVGLFWIVDVWRIRFWTTLFVVIGANALFPYVIRHFIDFGAAAHKLLCGIDTALPACWTPVLDRLGAFAIIWLLLFYMYRNRIFVRI